MKTVKTIGTAAAGAAAVLGVVLLGVAVSGDDVGMFTRDATTLAPHLPFYAGSISVLNGVAWGAVASLSLFVGHYGPAALRRPLRLLAALAVMLLLDDTLMLHEEVGPSLGIPEPAFYTVYALTAATLTWSMRRHLRTGVGAAFLLGAASLAVSVLVDVDPGGVTGATFLREDGPKLLGAFLWVTVPLLAWQPGVSQEGGGVAGAVHGARPRIQAADRVPSGA